MFEPSKTGAGFRWLTMEALGVSLRDLDHETGLGLLQSSSRVVGAEVDMAICCFGWILFSSFFFCLDMIAQNPTSCINMHQTLM